MTTITQNQIKKQQRIARDTAAFLANGGKIKEFPYAPSDFDGLTKRERNRRAKARNKGADSSGWRKTGEGSFNGRCVKANAKQNQKKFSKKAAA